MNNHVQIIPWRSEDVKEWELQRQELSLANSLEGIRFGSSETGAYTGVNKFESKFRFFQAKVGNVTPMKSTVRMLMGNETEPKIAELFQYYVHAEDKKEQEINLPMRKAASDLQRHLVKCRYFLLNPKYPQLFSSLDYTLPKEFGCPITSEELQTDAIIEIKNIGYNTYQDWKNNGFIAMYYYAQIQQQLMVSEFKHAYLLALVENSYLILYKVDPNPEWMYFIDEQSKDMAHRILSYRNINSLLNEGLSVAETENLIGQRDALEPEIDELESTTKTLKEMYASSEIEIYNSEQENRLSRYLEINSEVKELTKEKDLLKNQILYKMKGASILKCGEFKVKVGRDFRVSKVKN